MNKAYIIGPLIGLLVWGIVYWNFDQGYKVREQENAIKAAQEKKDRILLEQERRKQAIEAAMAAQEARKISRAAKDKKEQEETDARNALLDRRQHAFDELNHHLRPQFDRQKGDADQVKNEIAQLELQKKQFMAEETGLREYIRVAEGNVKTYYDLLEKLKASEDAAAAAAKTGNAGH